MLINENVRSLFAKLEIHTWKGGAKGTKGSDMGYRKIIPCRFPPESFAPPFHVCISSLAKRFRTFLFMLNSPVYGVILCRLYWNDVVSHQTRLLYVYFHTKWCKMIIGIIGKEWLTSFWVHVIVTSGRNRLAHPLALWSCSGRCRTSRLSREFRVIMQNDYRHYW